MPARVPTTADGGEWQRMLENDTSVMTYRAWRHNLPVRARGGHPGAGTLGHARVYGARCGATRRTRSARARHARMSSPTGVRRRLPRRKRCSARDRRLGTVWRHTPICGGHANPQPLRAHAQSGGAEYLSVTVFEGATPQDVMEFFNDDAHRMTWCGTHLWQASPTRAHSPIRAAR